MKFGPNFSDWVPGDKVYIPTSIKNAEAKALFLKSWTGVRPYLRITTLWAAPRTATDLKLASERINDKPDHRLVGFIRTKPRLLPIIQNKL
jgi:hypothetical protein